MRALHGHECNPQQDRPTPEPAGLYPRELGQVPERRRLTGIRPACGEDLVAEKSILWIRVHL